jgi:hypothetical protein
LDPRNANHQFVYTLFPPRGFYAKRTQAVLHPDPRHPGAPALVDEDGRFSEPAQWYYELGSDPRNFEKWWLGYFADSHNWRPARTPVWQGTLAKNEGHRILGWLGTFNRMVQEAPDIDPAVKRSLCNEAWKQAAERTIVATIDARGLLQRDGNTADMACVFHYVRTAWPALGLSVPQIYTLDRAQNLICTILTEPWIINADDRYAAAPDQDYLEELKRQSDVKIEDGKIFYSGGLFIGWKKNPSLHGTWDGLTLMNTLFRYYPDPDPVRPTSIYFKWNQLPESKKEIGKRAFRLMARRLWLDWTERGGPTWCWVVDGKATGDRARPSEAPALDAFDGYGPDRAEWAHLCWIEMFGRPKRNGREGVEAFLRICGR